MDAPGMTRSRNTPAIRVRTLAIAVVVSAIPILASVRVGEGEEESVGLWNRSSYQRRAGRDGDMERAVIRLMRRG